MKEETGVRFSVRDLSTWEVGSTEHPHWDMVESTWVVLPGALFPLLLTRAGFGSIELVALSPKSLLDQARFLLSEEIPVHFQEFSRTRISFLSLLIPTC